MYSSRWFAVMVAGWIALSMALTGCDAERPFEPTSEGPADTARGTQQFDRASDGRVKIEWTGRGARSLQALIDEAPDGALIELPTGTFSFDESIVIRGGRKLELAGAGSGRKGTGPVTHLVGRAPRPVADAEGNVILRAEAAEGFFNSVGSEVVIRDMVISGFDAAIVVKDDEEERSGTTSVYDLVIQNTGRGILALGSGDLFVKDVDILEPLWHGISVSPTVLQSVLNAFEVEESKIINPGCAGIYFSNISKVVASVSVIGAQCGGVVGFRANGLILDSVLLSNRWAGIILAEAPVFLVRDNVIQNTLPTLVTQIAGDGIALFSSPDIELQGNLIFQSARAGIGAYGSHVAVEDNTIICAAFDIDNEKYGGVSTIFDDLGGNQCGCGGPLGTCEAVSTSYDPPPPLNQP